MTIYSRIMFMFPVKTITVLASVLSLLSCADIKPDDHGHNHSQQLNSEKQWLAGDHHIHSIHSVKWDKTVNPPAPIWGSDADSSAELNAKMAYKHGLSWIVVTDHGGPNHSQLNLTKAYPDLIAARKAVPDIIQFYGMEMSTPGAEHNSLIIPHSHDEAEQLFNLERKYSKSDVYPSEPHRNTEAHMIKALEEMETQSRQPIIIANHPGRTATGLGVYTKITPAELRGWNDTAPNVAIGMEGSPGHQARPLTPNGEIKEDTFRGYRRGYPTMGGYDQMTARIGGFWDSMLGEGRHWWITASSDGHGHYSNGRSDFWPGEYSKTYIYAEKNYDDILESFRDGNIFVTTGDLISELYVTLSVNSKEQTANIGDALIVESGDTVNVQVKFLDPDNENAGLDNPTVNHVDIITGKVMGLLTDKSIDTNPTTKVVGRYYQDKWQQDDSQEGKHYSVINYTLKNVTENSYLRVRGTNTEQLEPEPDVAGENPWSDLWFYSNPLFIQVK